MTLLFRGLLLLAVVATVAIVFGMGWRATRVLADDAPGLGVGEKAPSFALKVQHGNVRTLDEFLKKGKVALVFFRSASW